MTTQVRPVNSQVFETKCHNDELVARFLGIEFGENIFPGFTKATVTFSANCPRQSPEYWAQRKILCIGCGNDIIDEHLHGTQDRQTQKCSATLMADALKGNIGPDKAVQRILAETLRFDTDTGCPRGHLAEFVKTFHRRFNDGERLLMKWHHYWVKAVYSRLTLEPVAKKNEKTLSERIEKVMSGKTEIFPDANIRSRIVQDMKMIEGLGDKFVLGLPFILQSLERTNCSDEDIDDSLRFFAETIYQEQAAFRSLRKLAEKKVRRYWLPAVLNGVDRDLSLLVFFTDDELAFKVMLSIGADIALIVRSTGHPIILKNEKIAGLSLNTVRAMIRWLELEKDKQGRPVSGTNDVSFEELECFEGTHPAVPQWYGVSYMIANGTSTHRGIPRTLMIADAAIIEVLQHAFHPRFIKIWKQDRNIWRKALPPKMASPIGTDKITDFHDPRIKSAVEQGKAGEKLPPMLVEADEEEQTEKSSDKQTA